MVSDLVPGLGKSSSASSFSLTLNLQPPNATLTPPTGPSSSPGLPSHNSQPFLIKSRCSHPTYPGGQRQNSRFLWRACRSQRL